MGARDRRSKKSKGCGFWTLIVVGIIAALAAFISMLPETEQTSTPQPGETTKPGEASTETEAVLRSIADGDTIVTDQGTIRLIGIDTPERGECGFMDAVLSLRSELETGDTVILKTSGRQNATDKYGRKLRYVHTLVSGKDLGMIQINAGNAVARFDSSDGYPKHPREEDYRANQTATLLADGTVQTVSCAPSVTPESPPAPAPTPEPGEPDNWWMEYPSCAALKRNTAGHPTGPFNKATPGEEDIYNWFAYGTSHRGDGDGDGLACE